ncbi:MAG: hypothetical protein IJ880_16615 [Bacilli bacterium]|nr:hypothetical protein [Bacilli bacterium]
MEEKEIKKPIRVTYPQFDKVDIKEWQEALNKITDECFINANTTRTLKNIRETLDNNLSRKYGLKNGERKAVEDEILSIHGIREDNFDFLAKFSDFINNPHLNSTSIDDNANKTERNMKGVLAEISLPISKLIGYDYLYRVMCELYGKEKAKELSGSMYDFSLAINDSTGIMSPYCYCMDASKLVTVGRDFGKVHSRPAQRLATYISTLGDTIRELSFNLMGALAIGTFFLDSANLLIYKERVPLQKLKEDKNERKRISNLFQQFIYTVNHYSRNATESPFTNISCFDHDKLKNLIGPDNYAWYFQKKTQVLVDNDLGGEEYKITYEEWEEFIIDYIMTLQEIFIDVFDKGDPLQGGLQFPFPVTTCNISIEITKDGKRKIVQPNRLLNYITKKDISRYNIYDNEGTKMASCCRLLSDPEEYKNYASSVNSFGGSSVSLGSCRVVTLNFHRAACEATSYEHFKQIIDKRCDNIAKILKAQRLLVLKMTNKGLHPFISNGWINFNRMFGTFGCIGYLEADQLLKMKFGNETFDYMKDFMIYFNQKCNSIFQEKNEKGERIYQFPYNIEQIPGESMAPKLAKVDYLIFNNKRR